MDSRTEFQTDGPVSDKERPLQTSSSSTDGVDVWSVVIMDSRTEFQTDGPMSDKERSLQTSSSSTDGVDVWSVVLRDSRRVPDRWSSVRQRRISSNLVFVH